jgi:hypothetical protein
MLQISMLRSSVIVLFLGLVSCTPEMRLKRLLKKNPDLIKTDTIWRKDTVIVEALRYDTTFSFSYDTTTIIHDRMTIKHFFNRHDSTVYISGECAGDTIYRDVPVTVNNVEPPKGNNIMLWIVILGLIFVILFKR